MAAPAEVPAAGPEGDVVEGLALLPHDTEVTAPPQLAIGRLVAVGAGAGALAGLLGVGGGIVMVPAFTSVLEAAHEARGRLARWWPWPSSRCPR